MGGVLGKNCTNSPLVIFFIAGSALGLVGGCTTLAVLKLTGFSMDEVRYWQYKWKQNRNNYYAQGVADYLAKEEMEVMRRHDHKFGESGKSLDVIDKLEKTQ